MCVLVTGRVREAGRHAERSEASLRGVSDAAGLLPAREEILCRRAAQDDMQTRGCSEAGPYSEVQKY